MLGERLNIAPSGKRFSAYFITPGVVSFRDQPGGENELLPKEVIDEALNSMLDSPLTVKHPKGKVNRDWVAADVGNGKVDKTFYDARTAWYGCEGTVDTDQARERINAGDGVSCGYSVLAHDNTPGTYCNVPYARKLTKIRFHHLALVEKPRYEEADIRLNGKITTPEKPKPAMFKFIQKIVAKATGADGKEIETITERENTLKADTLVNVGGKKLKLADVIAQADKLAAAEAERANAAELSETGELEHDGKKYSGKSLLAAAAALAAAGEETPAQKAERENAVATAAAAKAKEDKEKAEALERENAKKARSPAFFETLSTAAHQQRENAVDVTPGASGSLDEGVALGRSRYGSQKVGGQSHGRN